MRAVSLSRNLENPMMTSTSNHASKDHNIFNQGKINDLRKRNLSVISPSAAFTDQSERSSLNQSLSRGSNSIGMTNGGFDSSQILKRKIGGLARRNIALERTKTQNQIIEEMRMSKTGMFGAQDSNMHIHENLDRMATMPNHPHNHNESSDYINILSRDILAPPEVVPSQDPELSMSKNVASHTV